MKPTMMDYWIEAVAIAMYESYVREENEAYAFSGKGPKHFSAWHKLPTESKRFWRESAKAR